MVSSKNTQKKGGAKKVSSKNTQKKAVLKKYRLLVRI